MPPTPPPSPNRVQKIATVSADIDRMTAENVIANRISARGLRAYNGKFEQVTEVDVKVIEGEEYVFQQGFRAEGPVIIGTKTPGDDVFKEIVQLQGNEVRVDGNKFEVIAPTTLKIPEGSGDPTLRVEGNEDVTGDVTIHKDMKVEGDINANEAGKTARFHKVQVNDELNVSEPATFERGATFQDADGNMSNINGNQYDGIAAKAGEFVNPPTVTIGGGYFTTAFDVQGDSNVNPELVPVVNQGMGENPENLGDLMFTNRDQRITSTKTWEKNIKFSNEEYGVEGWSNRWKDNLRLRLGGDLDGEISFRGDENTAVLDARIRQVFGSVPNVRLYVSSAEGRDSNPGNNPNFPVRSIKRAAELAQEYVERRNGKFPNFSKINFPAKAYQNPGKSQAYRDAADTIWANRNIPDDGLIDKMSKFLEDYDEELAERETNVPGFDTIKDICRRDAGFLIEAVCSDLTYGGTLNMARAAARYFEQFKRPLAEGTGGASRSKEERLVLPFDQRTATIVVWDNLRDDIRALFDENNDSDVLETIDALFLGLKNTLQSPLPFQTNFSFEARSGNSFGDNRFSELVSGDITRNVDGAAVPYQNTWIDKVKEYLLTLELEEEIEPNVSFTEETVRDIYNAVAEDMKNGGIEHSARKAGEFFSQNVRLLREGNVRPIVLSLQYAEQLVVDEANVLESEVDSIELTEYVKRFRGLMEGVYTTIQFPTTFAPTPVTIFVTSGVYVEEPPIYLAPNVSVVGDSLRSVLVYANKETGSDRTDFFHCNSGVYLFNLRFRDIREPGFCAAFPSALVDVKNTMDNLDQDGIPQYYRIVGPDEDKPDEARVLFSYPGYTKFNRPKVYVDEPRDSNTIVQEIIVTDQGDGYDANVLQTLINAKKIRIRDIGEMKNKILDEDGNPVPFEITEGGMTWEMDDYYDEDNLDGLDLPTGVPDIRAGFRIDVENGMITSIKLNTDSITGRSLHGRGYRGQAAFLDLPAPKNGGRRARAIVVMKSDYAELSIPEDGIDENGRIVKVKIDHPGSGYTDVSNPWISIPPPTDLQPYVNASPYVQNCSNLSGPFDTNGNLVPKTLPLPFDVNDIYGDNTDVRINPNGAGGGIRVDGACVAPRSPVPSFVTDAFTQLNQGGIGFLLINRGYAQLVSTFGLFCSTHVKALGGSFANISNTVTDFGIESMHARGYWPIPYANTKIVAPRVMVGDENLLVTDHPLKLDAGIFNPKIDQETSGVYIPDEGYRSEVRLDEVASFWGAGYDDIAVTEEDFFAPGVNAYYLVTEIDPPPSQSNGNLTARFESPSNEYAIYLNGEEGWVNFKIVENEWRRKDNDEVVTNRTGRVRTFVRVTRENLVSGSGEFLSLNVAKDWAQGDTREPSDRQMFKGAGYKEVPNVTVILMDKEMNDGTSLSEIITRPVEIRMSLSRVTPIVVKLDQDLIQRLVRPKFMSVCRINGVWHTVRGVTRVGSENPDSADPFQPGEYALTLFPAVNWVNDQTDLAFYDASYISTNSHAMEYVGSGVTYNALPEYGGVPNSAGEVVEFSPGRVFFTTQDQLGNTRIGKDFSVDQLSGRVSINTDQFNLAGLSSIGPFRNDAGDSVGVQLRSVSNNPNLTSDMPGNTVPTQQAVLGYFERFVIPQPSSQFLTLQSRNINNVLQITWERPRADDLQGKLPNDPNDPDGNVFPPRVEVDDLIADKTVTSDTITSRETITGKNMTLSGNLTAGSVGDQDTKIRGVWEGQGSGVTFGSLSGIPIAFTCQVNEGTVKRLSFGGGSVTEANPGIRMPKDGKIISLTVQGAHGVYVVRNGNVDNTEVYSGNSSISNLDISFDENDTINFETMVLPEETVVVTFFVVFG